MKVTFLGTGGSLGSPVIGCKCQVCTSNNQKNHRLRSSILVEENGYAFLLDASPDARIQSLRYSITSIDVLFITHFHEDHIGGLNDLRPFFLYNQENQIPLVLSKTSFDFTSQRFSYLMNRFDPMVLDELEGRGVMKGVEFSHFTYSQESVPVTGYRFGSFAYLTDIKKYPESIFKALEGVEILVLSVIHEKGTHLHFSLEEAIAFANKVSPKVVYCTHISHDMDVEKVESILPQGIKLAYDGLVIDV